MEHFISIKSIVLLDNSLALCCQTAAEDDDSDVTLHNVLKLTNCCPHGSYMDLDTYLS